jgi:EmrB/QacA subfamily drug resistance transporter
VRRLTGDVRRCVLVASILGSAIVFLDSTVVNVALPAIRRGLHGNLADQQWVVEAYALTLSSLLLVGGSLGDLFGRRRVFSLGLGGFGVCSLLCAIAPSTPTLVGARALQGVAGALLVPSSLALIMDNFTEGAARGAAIGTWTAWTGIATVIGPLGGGWLVQAASWRWVFAINVVPVAVCLLLLTRTPESRRAAGHVDYVGGLLAALGLAGPVFALIEQPKYGWGDARVAVPLAAGLLLLGALLAWERRQPEPMLPLGLFGSRNFAIGNITTFALYSGLGVATFYLVVYIQQVGGYTPLASGLALLPITLVMFTLSRRWGALAARIGPRLPMGLGPIVAGIGLLLESRIGAHPDYITQVFPGIVVFGLGLSATVAPLTATVLGAVHPGHSGVASGVNNAIARVAGLIAIAAIGAVIASSFDSRLQHATARRGFAAAAVAEARQRPLVTEAGAAPRAQRAELHAALVSASTGAFRFGMEIAAALAAIGGLISLGGLKSLARGEAEERGEAQGEKRVAGHLQPLAGQQHGPLDGAADQPHDVPGRDAEVGARLERRPAGDAAAAIGDAHGEA